MYNGIRPQPDLNAPSANLVTVIRTGRTISRAVAVDCARMQLNHYRAGSGEPLVLIHGIGSRWQMWEPVLDGSPNTAT